MRRGANLWRGLGGRFGKAVADRRGSAAIEFAIIAPFMVLVLLGVSTYFVIGREDYRARRATYTAADMIARQTTVSNSFIANVKSLAEHVANSDARTLGFRASSASKTADGFVIDWSYATTPYGKLNTLSDTGLDAPAVATGESVIIVETSTPYRPIFAMFGTNERRHLAASFARPRTVVRVTKSD